MDWGMKRKSSGETWGGCSPALSILEAGPLRLRLRAVSTYSIVALREAALGLGALRRHPAEGSPVKTRWQ